MKLNFLNKDEWFHVLAICIIYNRNQSIFPVGWALSIVVYNFNLYLYHVYTELETVGSLVTWDSRFLLNSTEIFIFRSTAEHYGASSKSEGFLNTHIRDSRKYIISITIDFSGLVYSAKTYICGELARSLGLFHG